MPKTSRLEGRISEEAKEMLRICSYADGRSMATWIEKIIREEYKKILPEEIERIKAKLN